MATGSADSRRLLSAERSPDPPLFRVVDGRSGPVLDVALHTLVRAPECSEGGADSRWLGAPGQRT